MSVIVKYSGADPFKTNGMPTPYISRESEHMVFGEKMCVRDLIQLSGQIPGCDEATLITHRATIINAFSEDFKTLLVEEDGVEILLKEFVKVTEIEFPDESYKGVLNYNISLEAYDELLHNSFYGITKPENKIDISFNEDQSYSISRTISAQGLNLQDSHLSGDHTTSQSSSLENAIDFVKSLSGEENIILPKNDPNIKLYLIAKSETINRINNIYSISEEYIADSIDTNENHGVLRYTLENESPFAGVSTVSVNGELTFGPNVDFSIVRDRFTEIDFHQLAESGSGKNLVKFPNAASNTEHIQSGPLIMILAITNVE